VGGWRAVQGQPAPLARLRSGPRAHVPAASEGWERAEEELELRQPLGGAGLLVGCPELVLG
jgi:hypothetical protein